MSGVGVKSWSALHNKSRGLSSIFNSAQHLNKSLSKTWFSHPWLLTGIVLVFSIAHLLPTFFFIGKSTLQRKRRTDSSLLDRTYKKSDPDPTFKNWIKILPIKPDTDSTLNKPDPEPTLINRIRNRP